MSAAVSLSEKPWAPWDGGDEHRASLAARVIGNLFADIVQDELARYRRALLGGNPASASDPVLGLFTPQNALPSTAKGGRGKNLTNPTFLTEPS